MMKKPALFLVALLLVGCATTPSAISPKPGQSLQEIRVERVAVRYTLVTKRINFKEILYRVLWLDTKTSSQDFGGVWSPDRDLTGYVVSRLREQGIKAENIFDVIDPSLVILANEKLAQDCIQHSQGDNPEIKGMKLLPNAEYFQTMPDYIEYLRLADSLKTMGYRYLVELTAMEIIGEARGMGMVLVIAKPNVRIINLQTNRVVMNTQLTHFMNYQLNGDLKKLEENNMSKTKEGMTAGIGKIDFLSLWEIR